MGAPEQADIIPGTEIVFKGHGGGDDNATGELVLIPQPTSSPDDPLVSSHPAVVPRDTLTCHQNWTQSWKTIVIINQAVFVFVSILTPLSISPLTLIFMQEFQKSLPEVNMLFGAAAITLGMIHPSLSPPMWPIMRGVNASLITMVLSSGLHDGGSPALLPTPAR